MDKTYVVIPHYRGEKFLADCLRSVIDNACPAHNIIVVNNNSPESPVKGICDQFEYVNVIGNRKNLGFGKACNKGADFAIAKGAKYIVFLNQDTILAPEALISLTRVLESQSRVALSAPLLYTYDQKHIESFFIRWFLSQCPDLLSDAIEGALKNCYSVQRVSGTCIAVRANVIDRLGLFDPLYFMYGEDDDFCRRIKQCGFEIALVPSAKVYHAHSNTQNHNILIDTWEKKSEIIYTLKDNDHSFLRNLIKTIKMMITDQFNLISHLELKKSIFFLHSYLTSLSIIHKIYYSRKKEKKMISRCVNKGLDSI